MCAGAPRYTGTIVDQIEYPLSPPDPVVSAAGAAGLFHAEEPVDPVIKPGTLADAKQTLGAIEEVIGSLHMGSDLMADHGRVRAWMCRGSLGCARAQAQAYPRQCCRQHAHSRKSLDLCVSSSHGHSFV
jgi:hypothetical protein